MNILGIDFGTKNIGLAWVGSGVDIVLPYGRIAYDVWESELPALIVSERIGRIVVGIPYGEEGEETGATARVRLFITQLSERVTVDIVTTDESFTTREASHMEGDASIDEKAAMLILSQYLSENSIS